MKEYMNYSANDKMVDHKIFWDNVWNVISMVLTGIVIYGAVVIFKQMGNWF